MKFEDIIKQVEDLSYSAFFFTPAIYPKSRSYLFQNPVDIITVYRKEDLIHAFRFMDKYFRKGLSGYCLINYEAGFLFEPRLEKFLESNEEKLMHVFLFDKKNVEEIKSSKIDFSTDDQTAEAGGISNFRLDTSEKKFLSDIKKIKQYLKAGDTYQVNYTFKTRFKFESSLAGLYKQLLFNQSAKYSAFINNKDDIIISLSPELFFKLNKDKITSQPMKGTISRGVDQKKDLLKKTELFTSEKAKAENVMIVDLIRNDFGRICKYGSVRVPELFTVEKYESLFQMISTIKGKLRNDVNLSDVIKNIFPCGSVTGAPKIRTMEIINELEKHQRGIYTGSIGMFSNRSAVFNVAIRTLKINRSIRKAEMGTGAGIVWDSNPKQEYEETLLKSKFLNEPVEYFSLIETMLCERGKIHFLDEHLARLKNAADYFLFYYSEKKTLNRLSEKIDQLQGKNKFIIRLLLEKWGNIKIEVKDFVLPEEPINIIVSEKRIDSRNKFQYYKTTNRKLYEEEYSRYSPKGFFDVLFLNERGELAEGSITNIFIKKNNVWLTPPLESGIFPGIYRSHLLKSGVNVLENGLTLENLYNAEEVKLVNSVRGEAMADRIYFNETEFKEFSRNKISAKVF